MALRTTCIYDGQVIGIESIYHLVDGRQINIPEKVNWLRKLSKEKKLFCPCGCNTNLILVASDLNRREQHFRIQNGIGSRGCTYVGEGYGSVYSRVVLRGWLEDKLRCSVRERVPLCTVADTDKRYELSFFAEDAGLAVCYFTDRSAVSDDRLSVIRHCLKNVRTYYILAGDDMDNAFQYPEKLIKIQERQGFVLFLDLSMKSADCVDYEKSRLSMVCYFCNAQGLWEHRLLLAAKLSQFSLSGYGELMYEDVCVDDLGMHVLKEAERAVRKENRNHENVPEKKSGAGASEKKYLYGRGGQIRVSGKSRAVYNMTRGYESQDMPSDDNKDAWVEHVSTEIDKNQSVPYYYKGMRWCRCMYCDKVDVADCFTTYGGVGVSNLGMCSDCARAGKNQPLMRFASLLQQKSKESYKCPRCGGTLLKRLSVYGEFYGCENFPRCRFKKNI